MNKRAATAMAQDNKMTIAELRERIQRARGRGGMSRVNPAFPLERTLDIYEAALAPRAADEVPAGMRLDVYTGKMRPSGDSLKIANILRDTA